MVVVTTVVAVVVLAADDAQTATVAPRLMAVEHVSPAQHPLYEVVLA